MRDRSLARYLAPIALVVVLVAGIVVVTSTGGNGSGDKTTSAPQAQTRSGKAKKFYRVRPGDLLSEISDKTGVDIATIIKLNPDVDPQTLQAGQLIRLRK